MMQFRNPIYIAGAIWLIVAVAGLSLLSVYESKAGPEAGAPKSWPTDAKVPHPKGYTLVLAVHPKCPCTGATIDNLALLLARCPQMEADVLFLQPTGFSNTWTQSAYWKRIEAMPRTHCIPDPAGANAALFNAQTSGQAALYSPAGELLFEGGLTASRGHAGDNIGIDSIVAITSQQTPATTRTNVFGCSLVEHPGVGN